MGGIFVSHASADDGFVAELRERLEMRGHSLWVDSRQLRGGDRLAPEIEAAIRDASAAIVVLGPATVNSPWVAREVRTALGVQRDRVADYRVIPVLLPGVTVGALGLWFPDEEPVAVAVGVDGLEPALPQLLAALGDRLPTDAEEPASPQAGVVEELVVRLSAPRMVTRDGVRRAWASAHVSYDPAGSGRREVDGASFGFLAPLGPIEIDELRWYLESYWLWPVGVFRERARRVEAQLPQWGHALLTAVRGDGAAFDAWERAGREGALRRFTLLVDDMPPVEPHEDDSDGSARQMAQEAATELLGLPWELLHDGGTWLFQGRHAVRVRRRLPNRVAMGEQRTGLPIRILLISPRPERTADGDPVGYLDHRASALPLVEAVESLGELARLTVLSPATYAALERTLTEGDQGQPFDVIHFDGHGVYDRQRGLGGLCFEEPAEPGRRVRVLDLVHADRMAGLVRDHRIPLVFLDACQTALADADPTASVAARLLDEGVGSVVAMTHSVLVPTARRFVQAFYRELATGARVGTAMLAGQRALFDDPRRGSIPGAGELRLHDWFVPVLYQERSDPQPITRLPTPTVAHLAEQTRARRLGDLPDPPEHHFQGRSRELLALERHLYTARWAVVRGTGGLGKTTLAVELARWLVRTGRAQRAVFVSLEHHRDPRAVLDAIGRQLVPDYSVATYPSLEQARSPVDRALNDQFVMLVIDNCESVLPDLTLTGLPPTTGVPVGLDVDAEDFAAEIFSLCRTLMDAGPSSRWVFTTREALPAQFARGDHAWELGELSRDDAVELVGQVMTRHGWVPPATDPGSTPEEITDLVDSVHGHPRALVLLAGEIAHKGVRATTADLHGLMAELDRRHPGERENSLYASVALSIRRLSPEARDHLPTLACCHGGTHLVVLAELTSLEVDEAVQLGAELIQVGLGEATGDGYIRLDPGLAPYLRTQLTPTEIEAVQARWAGASIAFLHALYNEWFQDAQLASRLVTLDLSNLTALLDWTLDHKPADETVNLATHVEELLRHSGQPQAFIRAVAVRERAAGQLTDWNHARHVAAAAEIDRLFDQGELVAALTLAEWVLDQHRSRDEVPYPGTEYDSASAHFRLGRILTAAGAAQDGLIPLDESHRRFQRLADAGNNDAAQMAAKALTEIGDCLRDLGRWDEAAKAYVDATARAARLGDSRAAAVSEGQLATVRLLQKRYQEALDGYEAARATFEALGDPRSVSTIWHQIGMVHQEAGEFDASEDAYRHSLAFEVRAQSLPGQASTLNQLGNLYALQDRREEAVTFLQQAADIRTRTHDRAAEGLVRGNLAIQLVELHRYDEARQELQRALACKRDYGHASEPWKTWTVLADLENATGHSDAARTARHHAITAYQAYRRDGGQSTSALAEILTVAGQAIHDQRQYELVRELEQFLQSGSSSTAVAPLEAVHAVLIGCRDSVDVDDPSIHPVDAAELLLFFESLAPDESPPEPTTRDPQHPEA